MQESSQGSSGVPVGTIIWYPVSTPPTGWLICNGQSTSGYPALAAVVGANVPDLRGEFIRGADLGRGIDMDRVFRSTQGDAIRNITGSFVSNFQRNINNEANGVFRREIVGDGDEGHYSNEMQRVYLDASLQVPTANENRPRNIALLPCIKY